MPDPTREAPGECHEGEPGVVQRHLTPDPRTSEYDLLEIVADVDGCEVDDLPSLYNEAEHVVQTLFNTPPSSARMSISFSYAGYRVTIDREGCVELARLNGAAHR